jgi:hypothetical protein
LGEDVKALKIYMVKQAVAKKGGKHNRAALLEEKRAGAVARRLGKSTKENGSENVDYSSEREAEEYFSKRDRQIKKSQKNRERGPGRKDKHRRHRNGIEKKQNEKKRQDTFAFKLFWMAIQIQIPTTPRNSGKPF